MEYANIVSGRFLDRPNRFVAHVEIGGGAVVCHVKNTGRCRELLVPGAVVFLQDFGAEHPGRKTRYDLIGVEKLRPRGGPLFINMDSQAPNRVFAEWARGGGFRPGLTLLRPETRYRASRFDFYYETDRGERGFVEVKGVTLEEDGVCSFPDAPTLRGVKHLEELTAAVEEGYAAHVCFVVQMEGMAVLCPNDRTHAAFGQALRRAASAGVEVLAVECAAAPARLAARGPLPVSLEDIRWERKD